MHGLFFLRFMEGWETCLETCENFYGRVKFAGHFLATFVKLATFNLARPLKCGEIVEILWRNSTSVIMSLNKIYFNFWPKIEQIGHFGQKYLANWPLFGHFFIEEKRTSTWAFDANWSFGHLFLLIN